MTKLAKRNSTWIYKLLETTEYKSTDPAQSHILPEDQSRNLPVKRFCHDQRKNRQ